MKMGVLGYIFENGKVLMLYRNKKKNDMHEGKWVAPGGHIEKNESPFEALKREIKEETGLNVLKANLKMLLTFPEDEVSPFGDVWYGYVFIVEKYEGTLIECSEGDLKWIEIEKLNELPMWEGDKIFTPLLFKDGLYDVKLTYKNEKLIGYEINRI